MGATQEATVVLEIGQLDPAQPGEHRLRPLLEPRADAVGGVHAVEGEVMHGEQGGLHEVVQCGPVMGEGGRMDGQHVDDGVREGARVEDAHRPIRFQFAQGRLEGDQGIDAACAPGRRVLVETEGHRLHLIRREPSALQQGRKHQRAHRRLLDADPRPRQVGEMHGTAGQDTVRAGGDVEHHRHDER